MTVHGRKLAQFSQIVYISRSEDGCKKHSEGLPMIFGEYSDIVENGIPYNAKISRLLNIFVLWGLASMNLLTSVSVMRYPLIPSFSLTITSDKKYI